MQVDSGIPLGWYHCFGCGGKGPYNTLAEIAGFEKIQDWKKASDIGTNLITRAVEEDLLGEAGDTFAHVKEVMRCKEARRWPISLDWRGYSGQLIYDVGGHIIADDKKDSVGVLFPVKVNGKVRGGIRAVYQREGKELGYVNMPGAWTGKYGLFPFVYSRKLIRQNKLDFLFLVEGPRDALRFVSMGIPALAILGASSMSEVKALIISNIDVPNIYVMTDNDKGGDQMWKSVKKFLKGHNGINLKRMQLPKDLDENGEVIKLDPGNMPRRIVKQVFKFLKTTHNFTSGKIK